MSKISSSAFAAPLSRSQNQTQVSDPFLRKNQVWFQKVLPPTIEAKTKAQKPPNHTEQIALRLLHPQPSDRRGLTPQHYKQRISSLEERLQRASNQLPQGLAVATLLRKEQTLIGLFNASRLTAVPC